MWWCCGVVEARGQRMRPPSHMCAMRKRTLAVVACGGITECATNCVVNCGTLSLCAMPWRGGGVQTVYGRPMLCEACRCAGVHDACSAYRVASGRDCALLLRSRLQLRNSVHMCMCHRVWTSDGRDQRAQRALENVRHTIRQHHSMLRIVFTRMCRLVGSTGLMQLRPPRWSHERRVVERMLWRAWTHPHRRWRRTAS